MWDSLTSTLPLNNGVIKNVRIIAAKLTQSQFTDRLFAVKMQTYKLSEKVLLMLQTISRFKLDSQLFRSKKVRKDG